MPNDATKWYKQLQKGVKKNAQYKNPHLLHLKHKQKHRKPREDYAACENNIIKI